MIIALPKLDARRLAADFCGLVRSEVNPAELVDNIEEVLDVGQLLADAITLQFGRNWSFSEIDPAELERCLSESKAAGYGLRRVLLACEFSATARDRLAIDGHSVLSCDLLPSEAPGPHYQGDVRDVIGDGWSDMLAFPPCTYLTSSGLHWNTRQPERAAKTAEALEFVRELLDADIDRIALENPQGCIGTQIRPADQYVQPYEFGDDASKKTGLWLKGFAKLVPTSRVPGRLVTCNGKLVERWSNQCDSGQNILGPSVDRWKIRSKSYAGIIDAMARQWFGTESPRATTA